MNAPTPGPWHCVPGTPIILTNEDGTLIASAAVKGMASAQQRANARLIAAGHDLLAACKAALLFHGATIWGPEEAAEWHALVDPLLGKPAGSANAKILCDAIRAAITKATGEGA